MADRSIESIIDQMRKWTDGLRPLPVWEQILAVLDDWQRQADEIERLRLTSSAGTIGFLSVVEKLTKTETERDALGEQNAKLAADNARLDVANRRLVDAQRDECPRCGAGISQDCADWCAPMGGEW